MAEHQNRNVAARITINHLLAIICVAFTVLPLTPNPAMADPVADGLAAYQRGDYPAAYKLCLPWAQHGNRDAMFLIGLMYANGHGVRQSYAEAARWYQDAADDGQDAAQNNLGQMYAAGRGVRGSLTQAAKLYWRAADQGNYRAQYNLAVAYRDGKGVEQDYVRAYMWFTLSAAAGRDPEVHDKASKERDDLAKEMTPTQVAQAEAEAASWKPTVRHSPWPLAPGEPNPSNAWPHHP
jgi:TPR repeat protein